MANANSSAASRLRPSKDAILRTLEKLTTAEEAARTAAASAAAKTLPPQPRLASGVYRFDEFAGIERLDRAELDETDEG
jgi:hypothetical protein